LQNHESHIHAPQILETSVLAAAGVSSPLWQSGARAQVSSPAPRALPRSRRSFPWIRESLSAYHMPDWFADAKLGMWNHWGRNPQPSTAIGMRGACMSRVSRSISTT